ncbi:unnamed protein product [Symbiodinium sp. CCMP2456]|nr:unnamed protein product [Symbiodinium sp. CCMP2456]
MEMQEALDAARDRATDAEMECEDLRKQLQLGQTARASAKGEGDDDSHLFEKLAELQEQLDVARDRELRERLMEMQEALDAARDRATDAEMECEDMRKQLHRATDAEMECESLRRQPEGSGQRQPADTDADDDAEELRERLMEMQEALDAARDRATDAEMECEDLHRKLRNSAVQQLTDKMVLQDGKTQRELELEKQIADLMGDLRKS